MAAQPAVAGIFLVLDHLLGAKEPAAVALVDLVLCLVMAKVALVTLLGSGSAAPLPSLESRLAASMIGVGAATQTVMGDLPGAGAEP